MLGQGDMYIVQRIMAEKLQADFQSTSTEFSTAPCRDTRMGLKESLAFLVWQNMHY